MGVKVKKRKPGEWWLYIDHNGKRKAKKIGRDEQKDGHWVPGHFKSEVDELDGAQPDATHTQQRTSI